MVLLKRYVAFLFIFLSAGYCVAQKNIAGTWEGDLGNDEFLQLNIVQNGDRICGYSWDCLKLERRNYCKAYFTGYYDRTKSKWILQGSSFIENSGGHLLMRIFLGNHMANGENILEGSATLKSTIMSLLTGGIDDEVYLKQVSSRPQKILPEMNDCFPKEKKARDTVVTKPVKPADTITEKKPATAKPKDSIITEPKWADPADSIVATIPRSMVSNDSVTIPKQVVKRKNKVQGHIDVDVKNITLNVYDNAIVDGDTVSIFYNDKLLISHQRLSEKPIVINLELDEKQTHHEIILFAENLGSIPPNTALIVVYAGSKRYELFSSASMEENAVLVFDYLPKK